MTASTMGSAVPGSAAPGGDDLPADRTPGFVLFRLGERMYATRLAEVREVVRLTELAALPGMAAPLAGILDLRGRSLPVLDLRPAGPGRLAGDVLVLGARASVAEPVGFAVDAVTAVVPELPGTAAGERDAVLPAYVEQVRSAQGGQVFVVDIRRMIEVLGSARRPARQRTPKTPAPRAAPSSANCGPCCHPGQAVQT
ncbi:MAG: hypothetical protein NVSMB13_17530 [Mycobacteriales bacterium]